MIVPIIVNDRGEVIDGQHRLRIAVELGLPQSTIPFEVHAGLDAKSERILAWSLNLHRRHIGREERRQLVASMKAEGLSNVEIAEALKVDEKTVRNDLCSISDYSEIEQPSEIGRAHGKSYPSALPTADALNARQDRVKTPRPRARATAR